MTVALAKLFDPESIVIVGASSDASRIGGRPVAFLKRDWLRDRRRLYLVNPGRAEVQGLPAIPSVTGLPEGIDLAIIAVASAEVEGVIEHCAARRVRNCIVFTSGFSEMGDEGRIAQDRLLAITRRAGMRLLGPNCIGAVNMAAGMAAFFGEVLAVAPPPVGVVSIASQSGAVCSHLMMMAHDYNLGLAKVIATGNEADIDVAECVAFLADDPDTRVIVSYLEGCKDGRRLRLALEKARRAGKPVIALKVGRSEVGAHAAASHTGALAGDDRLFKGLFQQCGVIRAQSFEEVVDLALVASAPQRVTGKRMAVITVSGGGGVLMADHAAEVGVEVPPFPPEGQAELRAMMPFAAVTNPFDVTAQVLNDISIWPRFLESVLRRGSYDAVVCFLTYSFRSQRLMEKLRPAFRTVRESYPDKLIVFCSLATPEVRRDINQDGFVLFEDPVRAVRAFGALALAHEGMQAHVAADGRDTADAEAVMPVFDATLLAQPEGLLESVGISTSRSVLCTSAAEAADAVRAIGATAVMKIASPAIAHKTDVGGVALDITTSEQAAHEFDAMVRRVRQRMPAAPVDGVHVARQAAPGGLEVIVGIHVDAALGPMVMLGLGGIFVEAFSDVVFRQAPVSHATALDMVAELRGSVLFGAVRGRAARDVAHLADVVVRLSELALRAGASLHSLDINPYLLYAEAEGGIAVDVKLVAAQGPPACVIEPETSNDE